MPSKHDEPLNPNQAALVLLYGNADGKYRLLDRDVLVIGRASGADLRLEAPDVSNLHCIVTRGPHGFHLRDCASRAGTRVNGHTVQEVMLRDEDVLQVGPFSFRVQLPAAAVAPPRPAPEAKQGPAKPEKPTADAGRQLSALRARVAEYDQRVRQLEQAEREVSRDRALLNQEAAKLEARIKQAEEGLTQRQAEVEAEITCRLAEEEAAIARRRAEVEAELASRRKEFEQRRSQQAAQAGEQNGGLEARRKELDALAARLDDRQRRLEEQERAVAGARAQLETESQRLARRWQEFEQRCSQQAAQAGEESGGLEAPRKQLDALAARLDERQSRLEEQEREVARARAQLAREAEQLHHERQERLTMREDQAREQAQANDQLAKRAAAVAQAEAGLREQRVALVRMMGELKQMQETFRDQDGATLTALQQENESMRRALAERDRALLTREDGQHERARLAIERAQALAERDQALAERDQLLAERDQILQEALALQQQPPPLEGETPGQDVAQELATLHSSVEMLRGVIGEKDALLEELQNQPPRVVTDSDLSAMEAELNQFRHQLEADRKKLNKEIESVRTRNQELDEATRELELELSRERAELARERQRLERLREEVRAEVEKGQREGGMRDRLAPVQKLRDEINERRGGPSTPAPASNGSRPIPGRSNS